MSNNSKKKEKNVFTWAKPPEQTNQVKVQFTQLKTLNINQTRGTEKRKHRQKQSETT